MKFEQRTALIKVIRDLEAYYREYGPSVRIVTWCDSCHTWSDEVKVNFRANLGLDKNVNAVTIESSSHSSLLDEPPHARRYADYRPIPRPPFWKRVIWSIQRPWQ